MLLSHKFRFGMIALLVALATAFVVSCDNDDDGDKAPVTGTLTGTVIFHGDWPDSGTVQLSIFENWNIAAGNCSWCVNAAGGPPAYYTDASFFQDPDPNNLSDADTITFEITGISLGQYNSIVTGWRAPTVSDIAGDEPIIGMYGGDPLADDSLPTGVSFSEASSEINVELHTYFDYFLPVPGCGDRGRIEGTVDLQGDFPAGGMIVMISAFPFTPWIAPMGAPTAYYTIESEEDLSYRFTPPFGTYYVSVWSNTPPPGQPAWYGAYNLDTHIAPGDLLGTQARPTSFVLDSNQVQYSDINVTAYYPAPHFISGSVNFTGTRPAEGLLVILTTAPVSPEQPPMGAPAGYFAIVDGTESLYALSGMPEGTYYLSLWNNVQGPGAACYGAYGWATGDAPDPVVIDGTANFGRVAINLHN